eukprot:scaffold8114_cov112-Isochrysis_galbana.AAC.2
MKRSLTCSATVVRVSPRPRHDIARARDVRGRAALDVRALFRWPIQAANFEMLAGDVRGDGTGMLPERGEAGGDI